MYLSYDEFLEDTYEKDLQNAKTLLYDTNECITNHGYTWSTLFSGLVLCSYNRTRKYNIPSFVRWFNVRYNNNRH